MIDEQINSAIAEVCWEKPDGVEYFRWDSGCFYYTRRFPDGSLSPCYSGKFAKYTEDLNAMRKSEAALDKDGTMNNRLRFGAELYKLLIDRTPLTTEALVWYLVSATAKQRAEAFLRTIGKWKDESP